MASTSETGNLRRPVAAGISAGLTVVVGSAALVVGGIVLNTVLERHEEREARAAERPEREKQAGVVQAFVTCSRNALSTEDYPHRMAEIAREALDEMRRCGDSPDLDLAFQSLGIVVGPPRTIDQRIMKAIGATRPSPTVPVSDQAVVEQHLKTFVRAVDAGRTGRAVQHWRRLRDYLLEFPDDVEAALEMALAVG